MEGGNKLVMFWVSRRESMTERPKIKAPGMPACRFFCLPIRLPGCLSACMLNYLLACLPNFLLAFLIARPPTQYPPHLMPTYLLACKRTTLLICITTSIIGHIFQKNIENLGKLVTPRNFIKIFIKIAQFALFWILLLRNDKQNKIANSSRNWRKIAFLEFMVTRVTLSETNAPFFFKTMVFTV